MKQTIWNTKLFQFSEGETNQVVKLTQFRQTLNKTIAQKRTWGQSTTTIGPLGLADRHMDRPTDVCLVHIYALPTNIYRRKSVPQDLCMSKEALAVVGVVVFLVAIIIMTFAIKFCSKIKKSTFATQCRQHQHRHPIVSAPCCTAYMSQGPHSFRSCETIHEWCAPCYECKSTVAS